MIERKEFSCLDFAATKASLKSPVSFDDRNLYDPAQMLAADLEYFSIGRGQVLRCPSLGDPHGTTIYRGVGWRMA